jgi:hypothetical protein
MHRLSINRAIVWPGVLIAVVLAAVTAVTVAFASSQPRAVSASTVSNGGARLWMAFDPPARPSGGALGATKFVSVVNTSTANNPIAVYYEPAHVALCKLTLGPEEIERCFVQVSQHLEDGYFQVIAAQPVLVGGNSQVPEIRYEKSPSGTFSADTSTGTTQDVPLVWQQGCPPRHGSGCPTGASSVTPGKNVPKH